MIIGLTGHAQTGKDTVATILVEEHGFTRFAFADPMRASLLALDPLIMSEEEEDGYFELMRLSTLIKDVGWDVAKNKYPEVRKLLQRYGTEAHRDIFGEDFWTQHTESLFGTSTKIVISDVRFENEETFVHQEWNTSIADGTRRGIVPGLVWKITRPGTGPVNAHISDKGDIKYDIIIDNDGTIDQLARKVQTALAFR